MLDAYNHHRAPKGARGSLWVSGSINISLRRREDGANRVFRIAMTSFDEVKCSISPLHSRVQ